MKKNLVIVAIILSVLAVLAFVGCDMLASQDMMDDFIDDVNGSRWSSLTPYLHSACSMSPNETAWQTLFGDAIPLDLGVTTDTAATATGDDGTVFVFAIEDDGGDMKIRRITGGSTTIE